MVDHPRDNWDDLPPPDEPERDSMGTHIGFVLMALVVILLFWGYSR